MVYPSVAEYLNALQLNLSDVLSDPVLGRGTLRMHGPGRPVTHTGSFALTFEVSVDGKPYGVRCFHKHSESRHARYNVIADCLQSIASPHFVDFEYQPSGITTATGAYPIVRMEWADGPTLAEFVAARRNDAIALQELRSSLAELARHLREYGIAHGDIQPSNIIVQSTHHLLLIDYDGMFVPQLVPLHSVELGQPNFQHPGRRARHFDARLDAFSFSLIDFALDALIRHPELWDQTASDEDAFFLRAADLVDPANSPAFSLLSRVPGIEQRVKHLAAICVSPFNRIPSFQDFLAGRNIPDVSVVFSGDATVPLRRNRERIRNVVDAANFAGCCARVGDRVELIGQVVHVTTNSGPRPDLGYLRIEFADRSNDMVCLEIGPNALAHMDGVPDATWAGQWVCAFGHIGPVRSTGNGAQRRKDISIAITEPSQLIRITVAEARYRLRGYHGRTGIELDRTAGVRTVPVAADPAPPPRARHANSPLARVRAAPSNLLRRRWSIAAALVVSVAVYAFVSTNAMQENVPSARTAAEAGPAALASTDGVPSARNGPASQLEAEQDLSAAPMAVETAAGTLAVGSASDRGPGRVVLLNGNAVPGLRENAITLVHRAVFSDRDVVVGFTHCAGTATPCGPRQPFWIELRAGVQPSIRRFPGLWASTGAGSVAAADGGVQVDLGVWDGERRYATLTATGNLLVTRARELSRPLNRADCATVAQSVEACTTSRDCSSFESSARRIPASRWARLTRLYHESTGLDSAAFSTLCVRSCQLGLTPSRAFISAHVCGGAPSDQWLAGDPSTGRMLASQ